MAESSHVIKSGQRFADFVTFRETLDEEEMLNFVKFVIVNSKTVTSKNKASKGSGKPYAEKFRYSSVTYGCKHSGNVKPSGKGARPNQRSFKLQCPCKVVATVDRDDDKLVVKHVNYEHNHPVEKEIYAQYPESRRLPTEEKPLASDLLKFEIKAVQIQKHLSSVYNKVVTTTDILNLKQKSPTESEEGQLFTVLQKLIEEDPMATVEIVVDENEYVQLIYIQTGKMKEALLRYPEVVLLDTTYRINNRKMPLCSAMVVDGKGNGRVVAHAILSRETKDVYKQFLEIFKSMNEGTSKTEMFVVDKHLTEIVSIKDIFGEDMAIYLYRFHVLKTFKKEVLCLKGIHGDTKDEMYNCLHKMCYTTSEVEFVKLSTQLREAAGSSSFMAYFQKNWLECVTMWAGYERSKACHRGTTNHLESFHQKIKNHLNGNLTISEAIERLINFHHNRDELRSREQMLEDNIIRYKTNNNSDLAISIRNIATPFAADQISNEIGEAAKVQVEPKKLDNETWQINEHSITIGEKSATCDCTRFTNTKLLCRHLLKVIIGEGVKVKDCWIPERYRQGKQSESRALGEFSSEINVKKICSQITSRKQRYTELNRITKHIAEISSELSGDEFEARFQFMAELLKAFKQRKNVHLLFSAEDTHSKDDLVRKRKSSSDERSSLDGHMSQKKPRVFFSEEQKDSLRVAYSQDPYPNQTKIEGLASDLGVGIKTVVNWFHNHRRRAKQQNVNSPGGGPLSNASTPNSHHLAVKYEPDDDDHSDCLSMSESSDAGRNSHPGLDNSMNQWMFPMFEPVDCSGRHLQGGQAKSLIPKDITVKEESSNEAEENEGGERDKERDELPDQSRASRRKRAKSCRVYEGSQLDTAADTPPGHRGYEGGQLDMASDTPPGYRVYEETHIDTGVDSPPGHRVYKGPQLDTAADTPPEHMMEDKKNITDLRLDNNSRSTSTPPEPLVNGTTSPMEEQRKVAIEKLSQSIVQSEMDWGDEVDRKENIEKLEKRISIQEEGEEWEFLPL